MNLCGLQIQCLLILAREAVGLGSDLIWISAGTLLRTAMQLGYSRDPKHFPGMSVLHAELRRRLWAFIVEMVLQASFHAAMPPMISMDDFDTEPPANINDVDIDRETAFPIVSQPLTTFIHTTVQILLRHSLQTRFEIARCTINLRSEIPYDEVLRLGSEITESCREVVSYTSTARDQFSPFRRNHLEFLLRHSLVLLHRPWAIKARSDPRYYFSRKVLLETSLTELSSCASADYQNMIMLGFGIWRETPPFLAVNITLELIMQIEEESINPLSETQQLRSKAAREPLIQVLRDVVALKRERFLHGDELNVRCSQMMAMFLAQVEAMENGRSVELAIIEACRQSLEESYEILEARARVSHKENGREVVLGVDATFAEEMNEEVNYDFTQDPAFDFDMLDAAFFGDLEEPSWF